MSAQKDDPVTKDIFLFLLHNCLYQLICLYRKISFNKRYFLFLLHCLYQLICPYRKISCNKRYVFLSVTQMFVSINMSLQKDREMKKKLFWDTLFFIISLNHIISPNTISNKHLSTILNFLFQAHLYYIAEKKERQWTGERERRKKRECQNKRKSWAKGGKKEGKRNKKNTFFYVWWQTTKTCWHLTWWGVYIRWPIQLINSLMRSLSYV